MCKQRMQTNEHTKENACVVHVVAGFAPVVNGGDMTVVAAGEDAAQSTANQTNAITSSTAAWTDGIGNIIDRHNLRNSATPTTGQPMLATGLHRQLKSKKCHK